MHDLLRSASMAASSVRDLARSAEQAVSRTPPFRRRRRLVQLLIYRVRRGLGAESGPIRRAQTELTSGLLANMVRQRIC